jgi:hypothetical protein
VFSAHTDDNFEKGEDNVECNIERLAARARPSCSAAIGAAVLASPVAGRAQESPRPDDYTVIAFALQKFAPSLTNPML